MPPVLPLRHALATWCTMLAVAVANGIVRDLVYAPLVSETAAHRISTLAGMLLLGLVMYRHQRRTPTASAREALRLGSFWMALTVAFEFLFFHFVGGYSWAALLANYDIASGRLWPLMLAWIALAPLAFHRCARRRGT